MNETETPSLPTLPRGAAQANWFSLFNAISWQITLGSPTILYAKSLGASSTVLGIIAALTPLLVILQIPAANLLPRYGYRRFIMAGWGSRTVCIFGLAAVPLLWFLDPQTQLALVLLLLFVFNLLRGMASGAWMPWISQIIPEQVRARFLSRDQMFAQMGCLLSLGMAALVLSNSAHGWQFSLVFLFSALGATASLYFLTKIPDVTAPDQLRASGTPVPWRHIIAYPPFLRLTIFNLLFVVAVGGLSVFSVAFLRSEANYSERRIVALSTLSAAGAIVVLRHTARILHRTGSKPILALCMISFTALIAGWFLVATGAVGYPVLLVGCLMLLGGITSVNFQVSNSRLAMSIMPVMGRNHFFALYTVITNMAAGLSPIMWGLLLDAVGGWHRKTGVLEWNRYSVFFAMAMLLAIATAWYSTQLRESAQDQEKEEQLGVAVSPQASGTSPMAAGGAPSVTHVAHKF